MTIEEAARFQRRNRELHAGLLTATSAEERLAIVQKLLLNDLEMDALFTELLAIYEAAAREAHGGES